MAHWPWSNPYYGAPQEPQKPEKLDTIDSPAQIAKCMSCPYPACINCLAGAEPKYDRAELVRLILLGKRTALICKALGVREQTVKAVREQLEEIA